MAVVLAACAIAVATGTPGHPRAIAAKQRPNIVLILADDQRAHTMWSMPNVRHLLIAHGVTFQNAFVVNSLCCPSRTSILTGDYSHTTGVYANGGPHGGFLGRRYDPFCTECTAYVDKPPDEIWKPQVVRGEPRLGDAEPRPDLTLDRLLDRRRLLEQFEDRLREAETARLPAEYNRRQRLAFDMLTSQAVRTAFDLREGRGGSEEHELQAPGD